MKVGLDEIKAVIFKLSEIIIENEIPFCELDSVAGDGDFGMSVAKGFKEIKKQWNSIEGDDIASFIKNCSLIITEHCGGASGPIWGSAFRAASINVRDKKSLDVGDVASMFEAAVSGIQKRGGAKLGDKTLLDALIPAAQALKQAADKNLDFITAFNDAAKAANLGAENTKNIIAVKGRASYLGERSLSYPDAGAMAISIILNKFTSTFASNPENG